MLGDYEDEALRPEHEHQLRAVAGVLGWRLPDLFAVAGDPCPGDLRPLIHCRHLGRVFAAAAHLTTGQLAEATREAVRLDRVTVRESWQVISAGDPEGCPDYR